MMGVSVLLSLFLLALASNVTALVPLPLEKFPANTTSCTLKCHAACDSLSLALPGKVSFPNSTEYVAQELRYWSQIQVEIHPSCRVAVTSAVDVSTTLKILKLADCQFAVKSGAHSAFAGAANIEGGVTIDLSELNEVTISEDRTQVSLGPGNRWSQVYSVLDQENLSVIGGRVADIGVGGLTLGGGISYFSGRFGWACDNVNNYQVVFADGSIHDVNLESYPDLYFALRGGGNNFGIVTRFDVVSFYQGQMWGGVSYHTPDTMPGLISAFVEFNINHPSDPYAAYILNYAYAASQKTFIVAQDIEYGISVANPPIFQNITSVPSIGSSLRITNLTDLTEEMNTSNPNGFRNAYFTFMVKNDVELLISIKEIWEEEVVAVMNLTGIVPALTYQPISTAMTKHFSRNGGNALGISESDGPLVLVLIPTTWVLASDDATVFTMARNFVRRSTDLSKERGLDFRFIYQNYAAAEQDVFAGYGEENHERLKSINQKYDPEGVFTRLQPGYFKI